MSVVIQKCIHMFCGLWILILSGTMDFYTQVVTSQNLPESYQTFVLEFFPVYFK